MRYGGVLRTAANKAHQFFPRPQKKKIHLSAAVHSGEKVGKGPVGLRRPTGQSGPVWEKEEKGRTTIRPNRAEWEMQPGRS